MMVSPGMPKITVQIIGKRREPTHVSARAPHELHHPIACVVEFLATMKGYRQRRGLSQLAADDAAGLTEGHIGKLEIDTRRCLTESFWSWLGTLRLAMILVPAEDARLIGKCPCCGSDVRRP